MSVHDDLMHKLLLAKSHGEVVTYWPQVRAEAHTPKLVEEDHIWDLQNNVYNIRVRREFIIKIDDRDKNNPEVAYTDNHWTRSDFGKIELGEYILMREVYPEEM